MLSPSFLSLKLFARPARPRICFIAATALPRRHQATAVNIATPRRTWIRRVSGQPSDPVRGNIILNTSEAATPGTPGWAEAVASNEDNLLALERVGGSRDVEQYQWDPDGDGAVHAKHRIADAELIQMQSSSKKEWEAFKAQYTKDREDDQREMTKLKKQLAKERALPGMVESCHQLLVRGGEHLAYGDLKQQLASWKGRRRAGRKAHEMDVALRQLALRVALKVAKTGDNAPLSRLPPTLATALPYAAVLFDDIRPFRNELAHSPLDTAAFTEVIKDLPGFAIPVSEETARLIDDKAQRCLIQAVVREREGGDDGELGKEGVERVDDGRMG
ncbi:hypothetical protein IAT38_004314 [Cryptococcus sp. DSM 104549]